MEYILETDNLTKAYGKKKALDNVSIHVKEGDIYGLVGRNGAGKTTSFYMITGLIVPNAGRIFLDDEEITDLPMFKRGC